MLKIIKKVIIKVIVKAIIKDYKEYNIKIKSQD